MFKNKFLFNFFKQSSFQKKLLFSTVAFYGLSQFHYNSKEKLFAEEEYKKILLEGFETLAEGQMREFKYGTEKGQSILILRYDGQIRALSNACPHFGAPMHWGVLIDRVVKCPFHGASFDVVTGKTDVSPSIDDLTTFEVVEEKGKYFVKLPSDFSKIKTSKVSDMVKRDTSNTKKFVIVGAGGAGLSAAETLRQTGFTGEIVLLSNDDILPYDRTMLTKWVPPTSDKIQLRGQSFFDEFGIDIKLKTKVEKVDKTQKKVKLSDGSEIQYDKLLIASGSSPTFPDVQGLDKAKNNVFLVREYQNAKKMMDALSSKKKVCIVGGSFVSLEAASLLKKGNKNAEVTVIVRKDQVFAKELGSQVGGVLRKLSEENGIKFITENELASVQSNGIGDVKSVTLSNGNTLECDMLVFGTGSKPNTSIVQDVVTMEKDHIKSNLFLNTSDPDIYCAGDVASVPFLHTGQRYSYGHWVNAQQQGAISALNMLNKNVPYEYVPYYWTRMWDKSLTFTGNGSDFDEVFIDGDLSKYAFVAYYFKNDKVVGCASMGVSNATNILYEAFRNNVLPRASLIKDGSINLDNIHEAVKKVKTKCSRANCCRV